MKNICEDPFLVSKELTVENTTYCGANCVMCPRADYQFKWRHMSTDLFKRVIDQGIELGMQSLDACGFGDPFLDPEFEAKLRYVKENYPFVKIYTSTTCHVLGKDKLEWVCAYIDTLKISNFGFSKEVYESIHRGALKYEKVMENIHALLSLPREKRPYVIMLFLVFEKNKHQLEAWQEYWEPKVEEIMVWLAHNWAGKYEYEHMGKPEGKRPRSCGRPFKGDLFVRVNGEVSMCCFDYNHQLLIGDLCQQSLKEILLGAKLKKIRSVHRAGTFLQSEYLCRNCDQIYSRNDALLYSSNPDRKAGVTTSHPDMINVLDDNLRSAL